MQDRLGELRHQRELVAEQLRWLDREIAAAAPVPPPKPSPPVDGAAPPAPVLPASVAAPVTPPTGAAAAALAPDAAALSPELPEVDPRSIKDQTRRGCFLYVVVGIVILVGAVWLMVWLGSSYSAKTPRRAAPTGEAPTRP